MLTRKFIGGSEAQLSALETVRIEWCSDNGGIGYCEIPGTERIYPAQLVLLAMGFLGPEPALLEQLGVEQDERSNARTAAGKCATSVPGVFAAGDMRRGQSLVVWAIQEGRAAARECDEYLMGCSTLP
jgi:glutamate synthase (NADPH/NADH) small chain